MVDQPDGIRTFVSGRHLDNDPRRSTILEPKTAEPHHAPPLAFAAGDVLSLVNDVNRIQLSSASATAKTYIRAREQAVGASIPQPKGRQPNKRIDLQPIRKLIGGQIARIHPNPQGSCIFGRSSALQK